MEDSALERIIHDDTVLRSPREHLARNLRAAELVFEGAYASIVRIYRHTPGVILGVNQSIDDVDLDGCAELGYEVFRRPTGGSAVIVDPDMALCYSVFFPTRTIRPQVTTLYDGFVPPLADALADGIRVDRLFSLIPPGSEHPVAGHAMTHHHYNAVTQIDGIIHTTAPDIERFSRLLRMRELYRNGETLCVRRGDSYFSKTGRPLETVDENALVFVRSEREEISRFIGLRSIGISDSQTVEALHRAAHSSYGPFDRVERFDYGDVTDHLRTVDEETAESKKWNAQGHCFIYLMRPNYARHE